MHLDLSDHIFNYPLTNVVAVFYSRYPNSFSRHVLSEDVLSREITDDRIVTRKLIVKKGFFLILGFKFWHALKFCGIQRSHKNFHIGWVEASPEICFAKRRMASACSDPNFQFFLAYFILKTLQFSFFMHCFSVYYISYSWIVI